MMFAAFYYWFLKMTGKMASETLGKWHFWLFRDLVSPLLSIS